MGNVAGTNPRRNGLEFVSVDLNLAHFSPVRSWTATPAWTRDGDEITCSLHDDRLRLSLPAKIGTRNVLGRAPTAVDFDVLLRLGALGRIKRYELRKAAAMADGAKAIEGARRDRERSKLTPRETRVPIERIRGRDAYWFRYGMAMSVPHVLGQVKLVFRSVRSLLVALGRDPNTPSNLRSLRQSLRLWSVLVLEYPEFFEKRRGSRAGHNVSRRFGPLLTYNMPTRGHGQVEITLSQDLLDLCSEHGRYFARVPLPLPTHSDAATNLVFWIETMRNEIKPMVRLSSRTHSVTTLADKLGIPASPHQRYMLQRAFRVVSPDGRRPWYSFDGDTVSIKTSLARKVRHPGKRLIEKYMGDVPNDR